jgi:hypothetical protein
MAGPGVVRITNDEREDMYCGDPQVSGLPAWDPFCGVCIMLRLPVLVLGVVVLTIGAIASATTVIQLDFQGWRPDSGTTDAQAGWDGLYADGGLGSSGSVKIWTLSTGEAVCADAGGGRFVGAGPDPNIRSNTALSLANMYSDLIIARETGGFTLTISGGNQLQANTAYDISAYMWKIGVDDTQDWTYRSAIDGSTQTISTLVGTAYPKSDTEYKVTFRAYTDGGGSLVLVTNVANYSNDGFKQAVLDGLTVCTVSEPISSPVPEPLTMLSVFGAVGGIGAYIRKRRVA